MKLDYRFTHVAPFVSNRTSWGYDTASDKNVKLDTQIVLDPEHRDGGWYEIHDIDSGGQRFYVSGVLEVSHETDTTDGRVALMGYDGCFELPEYLIKALEQKGVKIEL